MTKRPSASIARKANAKAQADFATWLMLAKLGGFDDLPPNAQTWLTAYRTRLAQMGEADATQATIRELYAAYYAEMGGAGDAPAPARSTSPAEDASADKRKIVDLKEARQAKTARTPANSTPARRGLSVPPLLIFAGMVAALVAMKFAFGL
jgi:hypothetical protein